MPKLSRAESATGALRRLNLELHRLHARAGWPSVRVISREVGYSPTYIYRLFTTSELPKASTLLGVVAYLAKESHGADVDELCAYFDQLWSAALDELIPPPDVALPPSNPVFKGLTAPAKSSENREYELTDLEWDAVSRHLPSTMTGGRPRADDRQVLNGVVWKIRSGTPWRDVPNRYGKWESIYTRFRRWQQDGMFSRMLAGALAEGGAAGNFDWLVSLNTSNTPAGPEAADVGEIERKPMT